MSWPTSAWTYNSWLGGKSYPHSISDDLNVIWDTYLTVFSLCDRYSRLHATFDYSSDQPDGSSARRLGWRA